MGKIVGHVSKADVLQGRTYHLTLDELNEVHSISELSDKISDMESDMSALEGTSSEKSRTWTTGDNIPRIAPVIVGSDTDIINENEVIGFTYEVIWKNVDLSIYGRWIIEGRAINKNGELTVTKLTEMQDLVGDDDISVDITTNDTTRMLLEVIGNATEVITWKYYLKTYKF